jgi:hypothetical protein
MQNIIVNGHSVTNLYHVSEQDPDISYLEIGHNSGHYGDIVLVNTRFVQELRNFVWISGEEKKYPSACINHTNRQVLQRLNIQIRRGKPILLHSHISNW